MKGGRKNSGMRNGPKRRPTLSYEWDTERGKAIITKTIFENTNYPLSTWFEVIYLVGQSRKGIPALQIHRQIGSGDYRTAWYMLQRIRAAMRDKDFPKLIGQVEVDEACIGGKNRNRHWNKKTAWKPVGTLLARYP